MEQKFFDLLKEAIEIEDHDVNMETYSENIRNGVHWHIYQ
jgi:hypothetical protein